MRTALAALYTLVDPAKLPTLDRIMASWDWQQLVQAIEGKYGDRGSGDFDPRVEGPLIALRTAVGS